MIHDNRTKIPNTYVTIPIQTFAAQTHALASGTDEVAVGVENIQIDTNEITVMYYTDYYIRTYTYFPRSIIIYIIIFLIAMVEGIAFAIMS